MVKKTNKKITKSKFYLDCTKVGEEDREVISYRFHSQRLPSKFHPTNLPGNDTTNFDQFQFNRFASGFYAWQCFKQIGKDVISRCSFSIVPYLCQSWSYWNIWRFCKSHKTLDYANNFPPEPFIYANNFIYLLIHTTRNTFWICIRKGKSDESSSVCAK